MPLNILKIGGNRWRADQVFWGKPGHNSALNMEGYWIGTAGRPTPHMLSQRRVELKSVTAIYALLHRAEPIYVGETDALGARLKQHLSGDLAGLWDEFTWASPDEYVIDTATDRGSVAKWNSALPVTATAKEIVELLELVAIGFSKRGLNAQKPALKIKWLTQARSEKAPLTMEERIGEIYDALIDP